VVGCIIVRGRWFNIVLNVQALIKEESDDFRRQVL